MLRVCKDWLDGQRKRWGSHIAISIDTGCDLNSGRRMKGKEPDTPESKYKKHFK